MSSKTSLFLTEDNEHFYREGNEPHYKNGKYIGDTLVLEMSKKNVKVLVDDSEDLIIEIINPDSELYRNMLKMREEE